MARKSRNWLIVVAGAAALGTMLSALVLTNAVPQPMRVAEPLLYVPAVRSDEFRHLQSVMLGSAASFWCVLYRVPSVRSPYFFLPAMAFAGPLRVRALVWVR